MKSKRHFVYKITNKLNGKFYIGVHSSLKDFLETSYYGSGTLQIRSLKKHGKSNFQREVLFECESRKLALEKEASIVTKDLVNNPNFYNISVGGNGGDNIGFKKPCKSIDANGVITFYESISCASDTTGICKVNIGKCILAIEKNSKRRKTAGGLSWSSVDFNLTYQGIGRSTQKCKCVDGLGNVLYFNSIIEASNHTGVKTSKISRCLKHKRNTAGGYTWGYTDDEVVYKTPKFYGKKVKSTDLHGNTIIYTSMTEAASAVGGCLKGVSKCCKYSNLKHRGYNWEIVNE